MRKWENSPAVNISENEDQWKVELAVPGMQKEDFKIELDKNILRISAEERKETNKSSENYFVKEFGFTSFRRSFRLPEMKVEGERIEAHYENGVLSVLIPKREEAKPKAARQIAVG